MLMYIGHTKFSLNLVQYPNPALYMFQTYLSVD